MLRIWVRTHGHWRHYGAPPPAYLACPLAILAAVRHLCSFLKVGAMAAKRRAPLAHLGGASQCPGVTVSSPVLWRGSAMASDRNHK
eukprot:SAG11_NODE_748_length_7364_cov_106.871025_4_plen_86_part_00